MRFTRQQTLVKILVGLTFLWAGSSCATIEGLFRPEAEKGQAKSATVRPTKSKSPQTAQFMHTVRWPGESLSLIAKWYTGSYKNWRTLAKANPRINADHIKIGDKIIIPKKLLKTKKSMPRDFVLSASAKKKVESAKTEKQSSDSIGLELFEPKQ